MSFFNKVLASFGVGGAKVDTKLEKSSYVAGETIKGEVEVYGGNLDQLIDSIYFSIYTTYIRETDDRKYTEYAAVKTEKLSDPFTIGANETKVVPFTIELPGETPITYGNTRVWVGTGLDIKNAVDPEDKDFIEVRPSRLMADVLEEISNLGFRLRDVECEKATYKNKNKFPFVQEFEFVPVSGVFRQRLDELEVVFQSQTDSRVELLLQVDRKARGIGGFLSEALEMDESYVRMTVSTADIPEFSSKLKATIMKYT